MFLPQQTEKIALDFQNQAIQDAWKTVQVSVLEQRQARNAVVDATAAQLQAQAQESQAWAARNAQLDEALEGLRAQFSDAQVAVQYDANQLASSLRTAAAPANAMPCLGQRAHWIDCQTKYAADSRPCHPYVEALERCVTQAVVQKENVVDES